MDDEFDGLGGSLLAAQDVLEAVLQKATISLSHEIAKAQAIAGLR